MRALDERARFGSHPPRVPVHRHARRRQDDDRENLRQVAELRDGRLADAVRRMQRVPRHRRRPLRRSDRGRRRLAHQGRRHARAARQRAVLAGARPLQGLPDRRSAHAVGAFVQCAAQDARGAAAARQVPARDHRPAEAAGHGAVALPAVHLRAPAAAADPRAARADLAWPRRSSSRPARCKASRERPKAACATRCRCSTRCSRSAAGARSRRGALAARHARSRVTSRHCSSALAQRDGAALLRSVAELDERAPDYAPRSTSCCGRCSAWRCCRRCRTCAATTTMSATRCSRRSPRSFARRCAALLPDRDHGRRDLDYAPDARGGFEMALLRMLAFRPAVSGEPRAAYRSAAARRVRRYCRRAASVRCRRRPSRSPRRPRRRRDSGGEWSDLLARLQLQGPARQLAAHCVFVAATQDTSACCVLDRARRAFPATAARAEARAGAVGAISASTMRLEIALSDRGASRRRRASSRRASRRAAQARREQRSRAIRPCARCATCSARRCKPGSVKPT